MYNVIIRTDQSISANNDFSCRLYSFGEFKAEDQEEMLHALDKKVAEVYTKSIGGNEASVKYVWVCVEKGREEKGRKKRVYMYVCVSAVFRLL